MVVTTVVLTTVVLAAIVTACVGCGPQVTKSGSAGSDTTSTSTTDPGTPPDMISASGATTTISSSDSSAATTGAVTGAPVDSSDTTALTTGPGPGLDCPPAGRPVEPPVPDGCAPIWLVDANGAPRVGDTSGWVRCAAPLREGPDLVMRTAAVACPELIGDECLCDADCEPGSACICANEVTTAPNLGQPVGNRCLPADCAGPAECDGSACRVSFGGCIGAPFPGSVRCTSPEDDCVYDSECSSNGRFCAYDVGQELFTCESGFICE